MIYYILFGFAAVVLTAALGWFYLMRRLGRALGRAEAQPVLEGLDAGLNIPMRDGETRPRDKR